MARGSRYDNEKVWGSKPRGFIGGENRQGLWGGEKTIRVEATNAKPIELARIDGLLVPTMLAVEFAQDGLPTNYVGPNSKVNMKVGIGRNSWLQALPFAPFGAYRDGAPDTGTNAFQDLIGYGRAVVLGTSLRVFVTPPQPTGLVPAGTEYIARCEVAPVATWDSFDRNPARKATVYRRFETGLADTFVFPGPKKSVIIWNNAASVLHLMYNDSFTANVITPGVIESFTLAPNEKWFMPEPPFEGGIQGIHAAAGAGHAYITVLSDFGVRT